MSKLNPIEQSQYIESEYRKYLKSSFQFGNEIYQKKFNEELDKAILYKGPIINLTLPFSTTHSLNELISQGKINKDFEKLSKINLDQTLYWHQEEALNKITSGRDVVITTGTGSGKTESFLYPIINEIMKDLKNGKTEPGIRAMLLYPMNALVNDQMDRVRAILRTYPEITFGYFTGDTKEITPKGYRDQLSKELGVEIPQNELLSRKEIRENPPHILFTNYSMLEFLMIRPNDYSIFSPERLKNWRFVVLDEAHTYNGALGIEISMLLRRVTAMADKKPQFILTSATLGKQGESENEILDFAKNLTSCDYSVDDIIFAKRDEIKRSNIRYSISPEKYQILENSLDNLDKLKNVCQEYYNVNEFDTKNECLYELLLRDSNTYLLLDILKDESKEFKEVYEKMNKHGFSDNKKLISFIHLINLSRKNHKMLFDLKYHTFIRTLKGAFITIGENKHLRLTNCKDIHNLKAFEIGNCRYCNTPYIVGKIENNYLLQNNEIDIYENYGEVDFVELDYFVFKDDLDEEKIDQNVIEGKYTVCGKCGWIFDSENLNAEKCSCCDHYLVDLYKVSTNNSNNVKQCPCCGRSSINGVVRTINLGKDEGTALLAQTLYQAIDDGVKEKKQVVKKLGFNKIKPDTKKNKAKQFLAFSDSRQQASFFSVFFKNNHERFLSKRLIWKVIEDNNFETISATQLAAKINDIIDVNQLYHDDISNYQHAWLVVLSELLNVDGVYGAEGLGIFNFRLDLEKKFETLDDEEILENFGKYIKNRKEFFDLIQVLFDVFRTSSAIKYSQAELTPQMKKEYLNYRRFNNYVKYDNTISSGDSIRETSIKSFIPKKGMNRTLDYMMKVTNETKDECINLLNQIFSLGIDSGLFTPHGEDSFYQIDADKYKIDNYKNTKYYKCSKCGKITAYNVNCVCPGIKCDGKLHEIIDVDDEMSDSYYRQQYISKKIEPIIIQEHTAQIERKTAKQYQNEFKNKKINILSCSTTFEMGVDIGDLETVFLRNVPPTPANYVQRAGRAGRGEDSSAFVLTFCGTTSHDYTYFNEPKKMISGVIKPPHFKVTNDKIILRHLLATAFGYFFRRYPDYFKNVDSLVFEDGIEAFKEYLVNEYEEVSNFIDSKVIPESKYKQYHEMKWFKIIVNSEVLENYINSIKESVEQLKVAINNRVEDDKYNQASFYQKNIDEIKNEEVVTSLSKNSIIPKYGFPVDSVNLMVYDNGTLDRKLDLSRDLRIAISEYAPDSEIIVNGKKYTSKYISLPPDKHLSKYYYSTCPKCKRINVGLVPENVKKCSHCGMVNDNFIYKSFIIPSYGFKTGETKESTRLKPKKTYSGDVKYIGGGDIDDNKLYFSELLSVESSTNDELLVMNNSTFYTCPNCGYSIVDKSHYKVPKIANEHYDFKGMKCPNTILNITQIGHKFKTDVAHLYLSGISYNKALSFLYAMLEGISIEFNIERNDIDGLVYYNIDSNGYDLIIFDNVPGGAGHVKRIMDKDSLKNALITAKTKVSQDCCNENTSCYNCLRNYYNQKYHNRLKRKDALEVLELLLRSF